MSRLHVQPASSSVVNKDKAANHDVELSVPVVLTVLPKPWNHTSDFVSFDLLCFQQLLPCVLFTVWFWAHMSSPLQMFGCVA